MRIVQIITRGDDFGGAQAHVRDLTKSLIHAGHEVTVLAGGEGVFLDNLRRENIPCESLPALGRSIHPIRDLLACKQIMQRLTEKQPDIVALHSSKAGWIGRLASALKGIPSVFTAHGWAFTEGVSSRRRYIYAVAEKVMASLGTGVITVSEYDRQLALKLGILPDHRIITIHNGIPDVPHRAAPSTHPEVRLVMVARFGPPKDQAAVVRAAAQLDLPIRLTFLGDGPTRPQVEQLVRELGMEERVVFAGLRNDVAQCLADADIFLLASRWEGFPLSVLEAMRAALPVVASDVGGVREAVVDGVTGLLVPAGDCDALGEKLASLVRRPDLQRKFGEAGRKRYQEEFLHPIMVDRTIAVYRHALSGWKGARLWERE